MSSHLEKFVQDNRDQFDDEIPASGLWDKIRDRIESADEQKEEKKKAPVRFLPLKRWLSAVAAVVLISVSGWLYFSLHHSLPLQPVAVNNRLPAPESHRQPAVILPMDSPVAVQPEIAKGQPSDPKKSEAVKSDQAFTREEEAGYSKEMYYYTRLVEIKHNELKTLQKDEPLLYKQFSGDVNKLDSVYHALKTQLPKNSNREEVIEAMISNLQLQIGLLNKQLDIIKQIKYFKKSAYEKAYKSI